MKKSPNARDQTFLNLSRFNWWKDKLTDYYLTAFKWDGLPFSEDEYYEIETYFNSLLLESKCVGLAYVDGYMPVIGAVVPIDGYNWYGGSSRYSLTTKISTHTFNKGEIAICYNSPTRRPLLQTILHYAELLAEIDGIKDVNLKNQNTPAIIRSPHGQELTYVNAYEQVAGHKPVVFGREDLLNDDRYWYYPPHAEYICDKLELLKHDVLNDFFNEIGITSKTVEKRAQLITDEINIDRETISLMKNTFLDAREQFAKAANRLFNLNISVRQNIDVLPREFSSKYSNDVSSLGDDVITNTDVYERGGEEDEV